MKNKEMFLEDLGFDRIRVDKHFTTRLQPITLPWRCLELTSLLSEKKEVRATDL